MCGKLPLGCLSVAAGSAFGAEGCLSLGLDAAFLWHLAGLAVRAAGLFITDPVAGDFWPTIFLDLFLVSTAFGCMAGGG